MATAGDLVINLRANSRDMTRQLTKGQKMVRRFAKATAVAMAGAAAVVAAKTGQQFSVLDKIAKDSDKLGIATENIAGLNLAFEQTGVSAEAGITSMQRMTRRVSEAAQGGGIAAKAFKELGLNAVELNQMTPDAALRATADAMVGVTNQSDRVRLAFQLFGREGVGMINTLAGGSAGLEEFQRQAESLNLAHTREELAKVEKANDAINRVMKVFTGAFQTLAIIAAPIVEKIANKFESLKGGISGTHNNMGILTTKVMKWGKATLYAGVAVLAAVTAMKAITLATQAYAKSAAIATALTGPKGWLKLAAGVAAAGAAVAGVNAVLTDTTEALDGATSTAAAASAEIDKLTGAAGDAGPALDELVKPKVNAAVSAFRDKFRDLRDEIMLLRGVATDSGLAMRRMLENGMPPALVKRLANMTRLRDALLRQQKMMEGRREQRQEAIGRADSIREAIKSPTDKFKESINEAKDLFAKGLLSKDALKDFTKLKIAEVFPTDKTPKIEPLAEKQRETPVKMAGVMERGSAEAFKSILMANRGKSPELAESKKQTKILEKIEKKGLGMGPANALQVQGPV